MDSVTQDMLYRQSLMRYTEKYGVSRASRKYNRTRSYIYFWKARYDGTLASLGCQSRRPHGHPAAHTPKEKKLIRDMRRRNPELGLVELWCRLRDRGYTRSLVGMYRYMRKELGYQPEKPKKKYVPKPYQQMDHPGERVQIDVKVVPRDCIVRFGEGERYFQYTAIDEKTRKRYLGAYEEQSTYSSADFLAKVYAYFKRLGVRIETVQTDNGSEFTNRLNQSKKDRETLFEAKARSLGVQVKHIKPYTPRHNGKVERSHRNDQQRFYDLHTFFDFADFGRQLAAYQSRSNNIPMRPLRYRSPNQVLADFTVQYD